MAIAERDEVANDFVDEETMGGRIAWLLRAVLRLGAIFVVGVLFLIAVATIDLRYAADKVVPETESENFQSLLSGSAGSQDKIAAATTATDLQAKVGVLNRQVAEQQARLDKQGLELRQLAQRAGCSVAPTIDDAIACSSSEPTLAQQLSHGKELYRQELSTLQTTQLNQQRATFDYEVASQASGAALAPVRGYFAQRDVISAAAPPAKPLVEALFAMPTTFSSILLAFIGGLLGSACLLLILLTFPTYLPLTFGGGSHFFLRMFTGGAVAVVVMLILMTGTSVPGLETVQQAVGGLDVGEPAKQGMIAIAAGFLAEQIAKFAKNYSDSAFGNDSSKVASVTVSPPRPVPRTVPPAPVGTPAMGPGAMDEGVG